MATRALAWADDQSEYLAREWEDRLSLKAVPRKALDPLTTDFALVAGNDGLELVWLTRPDMGPLRFEFESGIIKQRLQSLGRSNPLVKAFGAFKGGEVVWDISFGQGLDALLFLKLGLRVVAYERDLFVYALATDAVRRAMAQGSLAGFVDWSRLELRSGSAPLQRSVEALPEYIYYDPMFSEKQKALPRKEMQFFAALVGNDADAVDVCTRARDLCSKRLIIKRSDSAPSLLMPVTHSFASKLVRYDMYYNVTG